MGAAVVCGDALVEGGGRVAYQAVGDGPIDVLVNRPLTFSVDMMWDEPRVVRFLDRLSSFCRHIWFDPRGTGSSGSIPDAEGQFVESLVDDVVAVVDAVGCERVAIMGLGVPVGTVFAATYPRRTSALVLADASARYRWADDYPVGWSDADTVRRIAAYRGGELASSVEVMAPSLSDDAVFRWWYERAGRLNCSPENRAWRSEHALNVDLRDVLGAVRVPTLVITHSGRTNTAAQSRYLADHIKGATSLEVPGGDHLPFASNSVEVLDRVEEFLTGRLPESQHDRVLATVLFTDIVDSTGHAASLGNRGWRELLSRHDALVDREVARFRGRVVKSTGDGALATFDGPARAIRCAWAIRDEVHSLGLEIRGGLHSGEIELQEHDVAGIAVHIGQRVCAHAHPNQVLVSRTVADLLAGSDLVFHDQGEHELKGVSGPWHLFEVSGQTA
jgi:class 3 adenylate cyclase